MEKINASELLSTLGRISAQAGVLVLAVLLVQWLFREKLSPRWRCALWLLVMARLAVPVSLNSSTSIFNLLPKWTDHSAVTTVSIPATANPQLFSPPPFPAASIPIESTGKSAAEKNPPKQKITSVAAPFLWREHVSLPGIILAVWISGMLAFSGRLIFSSLRLSRRFAGVWPLADAGVIGLLQECRERLDVKSGLTVAESAEVSTPVLYGFLHPRLLLPKGFTVNFSKRDLRFIFLHELAHLKRRDLPMNWLMALLQTVHWFNPLVWLGFARWRTDRELACDALALETLEAGQNREYGRTILRLLENFTHRTAVPGMVGILEDKKQLRRRIQMIANFKPASRWSALALILVAVLAAGCLTDAKKKEAAVPGNSPSPAKSAAVPKDLPADNVLPYAIDLKPYYQTTFGAEDEYGGFSGAQTVDGLPFHLDGKIRVFGRTSAERGSNDPKEVDGIKIDRAFDELHLLHEVVWEDPIGQTVAIIRLHYADGSHQDFPIKYGVNLMDWNRLLSEEMEVLADPDSKIIRHYGGVNKGVGRLFETVLMNPFPDKMVTTMDVLSANAWSTYELTAATVAKNDPYRAVTPALPLNDPPRHFDGALKIVVLDSETGRPLARADVTGYAEISGEGIVIPPLLTDASGVAIIKYPVAETASLGCNVSKKGYSSRFDNWSSGNFPAGITYKLVRGTASIQGVVQDAAGQPVRGATVRFMGYQFGDPSDQVRLPSQSTQTDADGRWSFQGLPANYQDFGVTVSDPNFPQAQFFADGPAERGFIGNHISTADFFSGAAVLKLANGDQLDGVVHDGDGKPVAGAKIFVGFDRYMRGAIKTDAEADGRFYLRNLTTGENYLTISAPGFAPDFRTITIGETNAALEVILKPGKIIHGRVTDKSGNPLAAAQISFDGLADRTGNFSGRTIEWNTQTDTNGTFAWNSAPDEPIRLTITKDGYMALQWARTETGSTNEINFTLGSPLTVKGSVTDADTGEPITKFTVTPGWPNGDGTTQFEKRQAKNGSDGHYTVHYDSPIIIGGNTPYDFIFKITADGYAPVQSANIKPDAGEVTWDVKLEKARNLIGSVKTATGQPAANVKIFPAGQRDYLQLAGTEIRSQNDNVTSFTTDESGHFQLPPQVGDLNLYAAADAGFASASLADFTNHPVLTLQPWSRVEGTLQKNGRALTGKQLYFFAGDGSRQINLWQQLPVTVDAAGHFAFPNVPPGDIRIEMKQPINDRSWTYLELAATNVAPGATVVVPLTMEGRPVTGHLEFGADWTNNVDLTQFQLALQPSATGPDVPKEMDTPEKVQKWYHDWLKTDAGKKYMAAVSRRATLRIKADGTFSADTVAPGDYELSGNLWQNGAALAQIDSRKVVIPAASADNPDVAFDIGAVTVKAIKHFSSGDVAPDFSVKTLDGQPLKLSDYRGKYVLLDFWATWCGPCVAETPNLKATYDAFGKDPRFVMISLSLDPKADAPEKFAKTKDIHWIQGFLGDWSKDGVTKNYSVMGIPSIFLIGPDGKIIAQNLRAERIEAAVSEALR